MSIKDKFYIKGCSEDDVFRISKRLYKIEDLTKALKNLLEAQLGSDLFCDIFSSKLTNYYDIKISSNESLALFNNGADIEMLPAISNGWKKGKLKIKLSIEFTPETPDISEYESPLDDIRREINQDSQS